LRISRQGISRVAATIAIEYWHHSWLHEIDSTCLLPVSIAERVASLIKAQVAEPGLATVEAAYSPALS
jgi:hypothetical protein